jgi:PTH1 family peptidyl-tRNA hydrolase
MADKYLIVGLGNPGRDHEKDRHNFGFQMIDELAQRHQLTGAKKERKALILDGSIHNKQVILAKPQTYMNLSGEAVRGLMDFYKIPIERIIVACDDIDIPLGTLRLRHTGSHGGQNGLRNIIQHLGTQDFARIKMGVSRPPGKMDPAAYVLQPFSKDDAILAQQVREKTADAIELWLNEGIEVAMTAFNGDISTPKEAKPNAEEELQLALRAHELTPNDPKPLEKLARLYKKLRRLEDAVKMHLKLAALYEQQGNLKAMLAEWEQVASMRPDDMDWQEKLAHAYEQQDNARMAVQKWLKIVDYYLAHNHPTIALHAVKAALRLNPQHPKALELQRMALERLIN